MYSVDAIVNSFKPILSIALDEDLSSDGDITSDAIFNEDILVTVHLVAKGFGIICGLRLLKYVISLCDQTQDVLLFKQDGDRIQKGEIIASFTTLKKYFLKTERIILNIVQNLSGIATKTDQFVQQLKNSNIQLLDTRKTLPGYRFLQKYAVFVGGGRNHRIGLYDMYMVKENHIYSFGDIRKTVHKIIEHRIENDYMDKLIEVECNNLKDIEQIIDLDIDIIMLDNMSLDSMKKAIKIIPSHIKKEVSGNVTFERLTLLKELQIDYISVGELTHSVQALDLSMLVVK